MIGRAWLSAALALGAALGCGPDRRPVEPVGPVARVVVTPDSIIELAGKEVRYTAEAFDAQGRAVPDARFEWSWERLGQGRLINRRDGRFLLDSPGDALIWAEAGGVADTARLHMAAEGEVKWAERLDWFWTLGGPALSPDGQTLYVLTQGNPDITSRLWAVRAADGEALWSRVLGASETYPIVGPDGTIYVLGASVYAVGPDGGLHWELPLQPRTFPDFDAAAISDDGVLYAAAAYELLALDAATGDTLWVGPPANIDDWLVPPTLDPDAGVLYASWVAGPLFALDAATGEVLWTRADTFMVQNPGFDARHFGHGPVAAAGRVHWPIEFFLETLSLSNDVLWLTDPSGCCSAEPLIASDGTLLWQNGTTLQALDPASGAILWSDPVNRHLGIGWGGGPALAADRTIYVRTPGPNSVLFPEKAGLFALDASGPGIVRWAYPTNPTKPPGANPDYTSGMVGAPLIGPDGTVYTYNADTLFAFWEDSPAADTPWPMWRGDARRSGVIRR